MTFTQTITRLAALPLVLLLGAACGQSPTQARAQGTVAADEPWGRVFLSSAVTEDGEPHPLVDGTRIRLDFGDDRSRLGASAGCNSMGGSATIEDEGETVRLVVSDLATTEMGCDPALHDQDSWLADFLTARPALSLTGPDMTLTHDGTEIRLTDREVADPDRPLRGTKWVVDGLVSGGAADGSVSSVPEEAEAFLQFSEEEPEGFGGHTGCNPMGGRAVVGEASVNFSEVITTKMFCEDGRGEVERHVLDVVDGDVAFEIDADRLTLSHPSGNGLMLRAAS